MTHTRSSARARRIAGLVLGLLLLTAQFTPGQPPARKQLPRSGTDLDAFLALEPEGRLKLVEKLAGGKPPFATATRGDLSAAVVERGALEPADSTDLYCRVKNRSGTATFAAAILWVIDEGSAVKKGDVLMRLESALLKDKIVDATLRLEVAEGKLARATEDIRLVERDSAIAIRVAEIEVKLAELELKEAGAGKSKQSLELRVERAKLLLERAEARAKVQIARAAAEKRAQSDRKDLEAEELAALRAELANCQLVAPRDGFVVYPSPPVGRFSTSLIAAGETVREGQKLLRVTPLKQFNLTALVHESLVAALRAGQEAEVRIDAIPDKVVRGKVTRVSVLPAARWELTVKSYPVTIAIAEPPAGLKPGMTAVVHIALGERKNVLIVPRRAVVSAEGREYCYVRSDGGLHEREVVVGAGNAASVEIKRGLKEGEVVAELSFPLREEPKARKQPRASGVHHAPSGGPKESGGFPG